jgi:hypothetical protein
VTKERYIYSFLDVVICLSFHVNNRVENIFKHVLFNVHDIKVMTEEIGLSIRKFSRKHLALFNYGSNQNQKTFAYRIENQT